MVRHVFIQITNACFFFVLTLFYFFLVHLDVFLDWESSALDSGQMCQNWCDKKCDFTPDIGKKGKISTMHIYLNARWESRKCSKFDKDGETKRDRGSGLKQWAINKLAGRTCPHGTQDGKTESNAQMLRTN